MSSMTMSQTILHLRSIFTRHGIPEELIRTTDHSLRLKSLANSLTSIRQAAHFTHGQTERLRAVQTVKRLLRASSELYAALLAFHTMPLKNGYSPAQLLFSRQLHNIIILPITLEQGCPVVPDVSAVRRRNEHLKQRQEANFNAHHGARSLPPLPLGATVFLPDRQETGRVVLNPVCPLYVVSTPSRDFQRNCRFIDILPTATSGSSDKTSSGVTGNGR